MGKTLFGQLVIRKRGDPQAVLLVRFVLSILLKTQKPGSGVTFAFRDFGNGKLCLVGKFFAFFALVIVEDFIATLS